MWDALANWYAKVEHWHTRLGVAFAVVGIPGTIESLRWWAGFISWLFGVAPQWLVEALRVAGTVISPVLAVYRDAMVWLFGFLPFDVPEWVSVALPPIVVIWTQFIIVQVSIRQYFRDGVRREQALLGAVEVEAERLDEQAKQRAMQVVEARRVALSNRTHKHVTVDPIDHFVELFPRDSLARFRDAMGPFDVNMQRHNKRWNVSRFLFFIVIVAHTLALLLEFAYVNLVS